MSQVTEAPAAADAAESPHEVPAARGRFRRIADWCLAHPAWTALLVAAIVRFAIALAIYRVNGGALFGDETTYTGLAKSKADGTTSWWDDFISRLYWGTATFSVPLTWLFKLFGAKVVWGQLLAGTYAALAAGFTAKLARSVVRPSVALAAGLVVALLPSQVLFSVLVLKDSSAWVTLAGLGYVVYRLNLARGRALLGWAIAAGCVLFLLGHVRDHTTVAATWAMLVALMIPRPNRLPRVGLGAVGALVATIVVGVGPFGVTLAMHHGDLAERRADNAEGANTAFVADATVRDLNVATAARTEVEQQTTEAVETASAAVAAAEEAEAVATAAVAEAEAEPDPGQPAVDNEAIRQARVAELLRIAAELREQARLAEEAAKQQAAALDAAKAAEDRALARVEKSPASNLSDLFGEGGGQTSSSLSQLPIGLRVMVLDPLPWQATSNNRVNLAKTEMLLWYPLLALTAVGLIAGRRRLRSLAFPILVSGGIVALYALSEGNFGTAFRHRGEVVWAVGLLAAVGAEALLRRRHGEPVVIPAA